MSGGIIWTSGTLVLIAGCVVRAAWRGEALLDGNTPEYMALSVAWPLVLFVGVALLPAFALYYATRGVKWGVTQLRGRESGGVQPPTAPPNTPETSKSVSGGLPGGAT